MSTPSDFSAAAIKLAIETTSNALIVEQENAKLRQQLGKNLELLGDFEIAAPRAQLLQTQLKEKETLLEEKRKELVQVQQSIISTLLHQAQSPAPQTQTSFAAIPTVMNHVQKLVTDITEDAIDQKTIAVPVLSLFKAAGIINSLYDTLSKSGIIQESQEEKEDRIKKFVSAQQDILTKLREVVQRVTDSELQEVQEEEEGTSEPQNPEPKVTTVETEENQNTQTENVENAQPAEEAKPAEEAQPAENAQ